MSQLTFAEAEYAVKKRKTRREKFLERMEALLPWRKLERQLAKKYSAGRIGRKPYPLKVMLRVHVMQLLYNLSDPAMEDALYEIESMRRFAGLRLADNLPDETTILNFRHFLEEHKFGKRLFETIQRHLAGQGLRLQEGSIVDASIIAAPTSTKNKSGERDPEMHQTKKGNEWHFGMKLHIGVDETLGLIHSLTTTAANEHDITQADQLLHGKEKRVWGDAGCIQTGRLNGKSLCARASVRNSRKIALRQPSKKRKPVSGQKWNTPSSISSVCLDITRFAIVVWRRTRIGFTCWLVLPTCCVQNAIWQREQG
jgi:IS5 family transposase